MQEKIKARFLQINIINVILFFCAALSAQRVFLAPLDAYICIIPLAMSFIYFSSDKKKYNTFLLIALFISVDTTANIYTETASIIRYAIYLLVILGLLRGLRIDKNRMIIALCFLLIQLLILAFKFDYINMPTLYRDFFLLSLVIIVFCRSESSLKTCEIDVRLLVMFLNIYLLSEVINSVFFYGGFASGYSNFDSTKALVVLPSLYYLHKNKLLVSVLSIALTMYVLSNYVTRMIIVSYLAIIILYFAVKLIKLNKKSVILALLFIIAGIVVVNNAENLQSLKIIGTISRITEAVSFEQILHIADPVRAIELKFFIDQPLFHILFGNGFGVGFHDQFGALHFIENNGAAFSPQELRTNYYYNLHDIWTDIGLRFGLLPVIWYFIIILRDITSPVNNTSPMAMLLWVLLFCTFFSSAGLLLIAMITLNFRASKCANLSIDRKELKEYG